MANIPSLENFDCDGEASSVGLRWQKWKRALRIYLDAASVEDPRKKKATLLHFGGIGLQDIFYNLPGADVNESDADGNDIFAIALAKLDSFFAPKQSKVYERHLFRLLKQESGEKFEKFVIRLRHQAEKCQFSNLEDQLIDQITEKCASVELRKKILATGDSINLDAIIAEANSMETVVRQLTGFSESSVVPSTSVLPTVNQISRYKSRKNSSSKRCSRCAATETPHECPAKDAVCAKCHFRGHYARCCLSKRKFNAVERSGNLPPKRFKPKPQSRECVDNVDVSETDDAEYVFHLDDDDQIACEVGGVKIRMLIDSGSKSNIIAESTWEQLKKSGVKVSNQNKNPNKILFAYGSKDPLTILGSFEALVRVGKKQENATFFVIRNGKRNLLGKRSATSLGVLKIGIETNNVGTVPFPKFKNVLINIPIDKNVMPISQPYRRIPIPLEAKINKKLEELIDLDIIEQVDGPSEWVSPMVPVLKDNGEIRICIDMRKANKAIMREKYPLPTMDSLLPNFRKAEYFSRLDIKNAFHQIEISPSSRYITTFISSKGLYRYKRLLFGMNAAPEIFQKVLERLLLPCKGTVNFIDDILIYGGSEQEHDERVNFTLKLLKENNVLLNDQKCIFKIKTVNFLGHTLTPSGVRPLESYVGVVKTFRSPVIIDEVHSFLGLVNFIGKWIPNLATLTEPLRKLLRLKLGKNANILKYWGNEQLNAFNELKSSLSKIKTLGYYDPEDKTQVIADASPVGLGAVLIQYDSSGHRVIAFGNKSLTDPEKRYCQTEKEALAIVWAVEHFKIYLYGKEEFELITDHKPLEVIFGPKSRPSARIERWVMRLQSFNFKIVFRPGKSNIADPLSRLCQTDPIPFDNHNFVYHVVEYSKPIAVTLNEIRENSENDDEVGKIITGIKQKIWVEPVKHCRTFQEEFCVCDGILLRGTRIVIPHKLRQRILEAAHEGHPGIVAMKGRLRTKVWWPKIDEHAEKIVKSCKGCTLVSTPGPPNPMKRRSMPNGPWIDVAVDFMGPLPNGVYLFVIVDYFSRYKEIKIMRSITAINTVNVLKEIFSRLGLPMSITCDNGKQFCSQEIKSFCEENAIKIFYTIPYWPQMNGEVERQNRDILKRLKISNAVKTDWQEEIFKYLMMYNSTPHTTTGKTPHELFFKRQFRDKIPSSIDTGNATLTELDEEVIDRDRVQKEKGRELGDRKRKATESDLQIGDKVYQKIMVKSNKTTPDFDSTPYLVTNKMKGDVMIRDENSGQEFRRNVIHLKKIEGEWKISDDRSEKNN